MDEISDHQQSWGYEDGPWKGPRPPLLVAADFLIFFNLCFIGSIGFDDHLIESSLASVLFASASLGGGWSAGAYQQIVKNMQKKIISIQKPPASIRFALIKHTLAVSVEPFKFSPAEPVAYELSNIARHTFKPPGRPNAFNLFP